jgi:hypothetical protein
MVMLLLLLLLLWRRVVLMLLRAGVEKGTTAIANTLLDVVLMIWRQRSIWTWVVRRL